MKTSALTHPAGPGAPAPARPAREALRTLPQRYCARRTPAPTRDSSIRGRATPDHAEAVVGALGAFPVITKPRKAPDLAIRDPSDRWILATAVAGGAGVLVTGDRDLLTVSDTGPLPTLDPRAFWELLRAAGPDTPY